MTDCTTPLPPPPGAAPPTMSGRKTTGRRRQPVDAAEAQRSLDDLVTAAARYRGSAEFARLLAFAGRFAGYSPFNALLVDIQKQGSTYVATARRWSQHFGRAVRAEAQPLIILKPFGPVLIVFDVSDTDPIPGRPQLPMAMADPFAVRSAASPAQVQRAITLTVDNAIRDGVQVIDSSFGSTLAGFVRAIDSAGSQDFVVRRRPDVVTVAVQVSYTLQVASTERELTRYATLCHELAHLYCGHVGPMNSPWWPDRRGLDRRAAEFEAEAVSAIAVWRLDPEAEMPPYLHNYCRDEADVPPAMSLDRVLTAATLLVDMAARHLKPRPRGR